jgi:DNA-binding FadR family transcriptional regulator
MLQPLGHIGVPTRLRLGEQVANTLLEAIQLHQFLPGERLPSERELCARLSVNRTAVREGLRWLEHERFIEVRRGKYGGAFVLEVPLDLSLERLRGNIDALRQLLEFRQVIEPAAAAIAAQRITESQLARLDELFAKERSEVELDGSIEQLRAIDREIHDVIASATNNRDLVETVREIRLRMAIGLDVLHGTPLTRLRDSETGHAAILEALRRHNSTEAAAAMERHVLATRKSIGEALSRVDINLEARDSPAVEVGGISGSRLGTLASASKLLQPSGADR